MSNLSMRVLAGTALGVIALVVALAGGVRFAVLPALLAIYFFAMAVQDRRSGD